ncbi:MAG TPA: hypothetical protein VF092_18440 [Longimicrobium sp.]
MRRAGRDPGERRERALTFLAQLAVLNAGYRAHGVCGWAHPDDFSLLAGPYDWPGLLGELAHAGAADAAAARGPGVDQTTQLYRISPAGMREVARTLGEAAPDVPQPAPTEGTSGLYVSAGARWALDVLRDTCRDGTGPVGLTGVRDRIGEKYGHCRPTSRIVLASDLHALVSAGLAERARWPLYGCDAFVVTCAGWTAEPLAWHGYHPEAEIFTEHGGGPLLNVCPRMWRYSSYW